MAGSRQTLAVLEANGRKHLSKKERAERAAGEVRAGPIKRLLAPDWLAPTLRPTFQRIAKGLLELMPGLISRLDGDTIARYCAAQEAWQQASDQVDQALAMGRLDDAKDWSAIQDRYFKQCRACANDLGMTITSRCRMVVPEKPKPEENPFLQMMERRNRA